MTAELVLVANAGDSTVSAFALDISQGTRAPRLVPLSTSPVGKGCSTFAVDAARATVYAAAKPATEGGAPGIDTFALDRASGALTRRHHAEVPGGMNYLALTPDGRLLAGAAYHEGFAATWTVAPDGSLGPLVARVDWPNAHCVVATADHLYVVSLGADVIAQYALAADGHLTPLDPPTAPAPAGSGPRHMVLSGDGRHAYVVTEFSGEVLTYRRDPDTGTLTAAGARTAYATDRGLRHSRYGADPQAEHLIWGADIHLARGEQLVLASERCASTLAALPVAADGRPGPVTDLVDVVRQPRGFAVSRDGRYAVVAGEGDTDVELVAVGEDGALVSLGRTHTGAKANWVRIL
jgi:6-phosphogluconolactonase